MLDISHSLELGFLSWNHFPTSSYFTNVSSFLHSSTPLPPHPQLCLSFHLQNKCKLYLQDETVIQHSKRTCTVEAVPRKAIRGQKTIACRLSASDLFHITELLCLFSVWCLWRRPSWQRQNFASSCQSCHPENWSTYDWCRRKAKKEDAQFIK